MKKINSTSVSVNKKAIRGVIFGVLGGSLVTILLTLICSFILLMSGKLPYELLDYITLAFAGLGAFAGGYIASRIIKSAGLVWGAITGLIMFIIVFIAGFSNQNGGITMLTLYKLLIILLCSSLGGIIGVNKKDKLKIK